MKKTISILFLCLLPFIGEAQTANAGADQTIYLTQTSNATLDGSASSGSTYQWTDVTNTIGYPMLMNLGVESHPANSGVLSNSTSKVATVTGLTQGVWYYKLAVNGTVSDTMKVIADLLPPPNGYVVDSLPLVTAAPYANNRDDTSSYQGYSFPNYFMDPNFGSMFFERGRSNGAYIDEQYGKLYTVIEDGWPWNGNPYARSEMYMGSVNVDPSNVIMYEWKGYFPQSIINNFPTTYPNDMLVSWQVHGGNPTQPPFQFNSDHDWFSFIDKWVSGNGSNDGSYQTTHIMSTADANVMNTHTLRTWLKEGTAGNGWIVVQLDGVTKYSRFTGQVGSNPIGGDYPKFAGVYDYWNMCVDVNNHTRNKKFGLVTESYKIYKIKDTTGMTNVGNPSVTTSGSQNILVDNTNIYSTPTAASGESITSFLWKQISGGAYSISSPNSQNTGVTGLSVGQHVFQITVTQTDGKTATATITVNVKLQATLSYSGITKTYSGSPQSVTVTTSPPGLTGVTTTYNGLGTIPTNAGTYAITSGLTNTDYYATNISGTFTINKASATISVSNINQTYTGSPLGVTASVSPSVSGLSVTYNGSATVPTSAGTYTVIAKLTNVNYQATPDTVTLTINKATATVSWSTPSAITYGTALSGTQLNATASVGGSFIYTPASGTVLNAGTQTLSVNFAPSDATDYNSVNGKTVSLTVNKATATITLSNLSQNYDGTPKPVTVTTSPVVLGIITTTYNGSGTVPTAINSYSINSSLSNSNYTATPATGTLVISSNAATIYITNYANRIYTGSVIPVTVTCAYTYSVTYNGSATVPTNVGSYTTIATITDGIHTGADTVTMTIIKATPTITWSNPAAITYGTALSGTQLNASSTVSGSFVYSPLSGTVLAVGTNSLSATFTPTDASNYNGATANVSITVNQATATILGSNYSQAYDGSPKPITATVSPSVSGLSVTYNGSGTVPTNAGSYPTIIHLSNPNYTAADVNGTLVISKVTPILSWATPAQINDNTALSSLQLNATSNIGGTFTYNYSTGQKLAAGNYTLVATFTPTDLVNYNVSTISTQLIVVGTPYNDFFITNGKIFWYPFL